MNHQIFLAVCFSPLTETSQYKADYMKASERIWMYKWWEMLVFFLNQGQKTIRLNYCLQFSLLAFYSCISVWPWKRCWLFVLVATKASAVVGNTKKGGMSRNRSRAHRCGGDRRQLEVFNLPFCPWCRERWGWPLLGCCTLYYNLLQAFSEISL